MWLISTHYKQVTYTAHAQLPMFVWPLANSSQSVNVVTQERMVVGSSNLVEGSDMPVMKLI